MSDAPPLAGVKVLDIATFLAAPFAGTILADFGATVLKIEHPKLGDPMRAFGTPTGCGDTLAWLSEARNKQCMTLDLRHPQGAEIFRRLVAQSDVLLENFRPGTLENWGLSPDSLRQINPRLVVLRVSAYGQTGPKRGLPGFARVAHGFGGLSYLAGEPDGRPVVPGSTSLADYLSGLWGAVGVLLALRVAERTGRGQDVDIGLYESVFRLLDEIAPAYARTGFVRERMGADVPTVVPHGHWQTADGRWVAIACTSDKIFARLAKAMGKPELTRPDRFATTAQRLAARGEVKGLVANWAAGMSMEQLGAACDAAGVPWGPINSIADIFEDPQFMARGNLVRILDERAGELVLPAAVPRLTGTPAALRHAGRARGADTDQVLGNWLGLLADEIGALRRAGAI
ncbi:CaiB/BaiF CoA transferase family protein [Paracraurococcus lichenis]|uniref:CaiB/BaiF CoA-transferase family protein n=1 Tax=Paracraurococcus lichenis TaxID=3064888 RepID=A0ABT9EDT4_9PROT|nr:CaiB/BaiF CoA-transferase family protein [Paracraurococcus sp. LOR1-02]MDO9714252.1 CaiB/BaiF CoA-transferase family protein [Paracraurococcus sp. LOR1-02]